MRSDGPDLPVSWAGEVTVCPDGPLLVRGPVRLLTIDGVEVEQGRNVLALCRCGRSRLKPLCDGSHRASRFRDPADGDEMAHVLRHATLPRSSGTAE